MYISVSETKIIKDFTFNFEKKLYGLMGPSGCGKTTLMNSIFKKYPHITYVSQNPVMQEFLTVREYVLTSLYMLTMDAVEVCSINIQDLKLESCQNTLIKKVSGGERKRTNIASELAGNESMIVLDEPISSLDSENALSFIKILKDQNVPIFMSLHQPSGSIFHVFDDVMFMTKGAMIFHGAPNSIFTYFHQMGFSKNQYESIPEYAIRVCHEGDVSLLTKDYNQTIAFVDNTDDVQYKNNAKTYIKYFSLIYREFLHNIRNPLIIKVRLVQSCFFAVFVGCLFYDLDNYGMKSVQNKSGAIFFIVINQIMGTVFSTVQTFPEQIDALQYDYSRQKHSIFAYFVSKTSMDVPFQIFNTLVFAFISLYLTNLTDRIYDFVSRLILIVFSAASFGYMMSCIHKNPQVCIVVTNLCILPLMLTGGYFINNTSIPIYLEWLQTINILHYSYNTLSIVVWEDVVFQNSTYYENGNQVLDDLDIEHNYNNTVLLILSFAFRIIGYLFLIFFNLKNKNM